MQETFICIHFDYLILDIVIYIFRIAKENYSCEFGIYVILLLFWQCDYYYYCSYYCISSLLILVDRLFHIMSVSKYSSSTRRAGGPTFKLGPTRICVWLEFFRRSSIDDEIGYICSVWYFKCSLLVSRPPGSWWARRLARSGCWSMTVERRGVRWQTNVQQEHAERDLNVKRPYQGATVRVSWTGVGQVRDVRDVFTRRKNRTVGER